MNRTGSSSRAVPAAALLAIAGLLLAACATTRPVAPAATVPRATVLPADGGVFSVAENALDTWNTIGKVLVAMDDVHYEGRAQMLGLYTVRFRGEQFLIRTQAVVMRDAADRIHTRVDTLGPSGKPLASVASVEMLQRLAQQVPLEVAKYRQPIKLPAKRQKSKAQKSKAVLRKLH